MKIIIFDGTFKTTTFINRLVKGLSSTHEVYIMGFNETLINKIDDVHYVPLGSNQNYYRLASVSLKYALKTKSISKLFKVFKHLVLKEKKQLQQQNLTVVLTTIQPDIIHLQWLSNIQLFEKYISTSTYKFILSQRGYHINIRPFVNEANLNYLQNWYPKLNGFHSVSNAMREVSNEIYKSPKKIDQVVYSGFDFSHLSFQEKESKSTGVINILSVGRNHWVKGYVYAIQAMSILKSKGINFHYTIIGAQQNNEELIYYINNYKLAANITLLGSVTQEEVYVKMRENDILLLPSLAEGLANVCIEAMALGLPVISTDCGGMKELITENETGFIVPTHHAEAIAEKVSILKNMDLVEINQLTNKARQKVEKQHNELKMITEMESLYKAVYEYN